MTEMGIFRVCGGVGKAVVGDGKVLRSLGTCGKGFGCKKESA